MEILKINIMSVLIDKLLKEENLNQHQHEFEDGWFIAKPMGYYGLFDYRRFKDALRILKGKAHAYHYKIDE